MVNIESIDIVEYLEFILIVTFLLHHITNTYSY